MKTVALKFIALSLVFMASFTAFSQDKIYKKNDEVILCKITEVGEDEIKYTTEETGSLVYSLDKSKIQKVVLESGKELVFQSKMTDADLYTDNRKNAFKIGMFSPLWGALSVGYERSLGPGKSIESSLAFIGLGRDIADANPAGGSLRVGYKFIMTPDFETKGMKYSHVLKGWYFRPEVNFAYYQTDIYQYSSIWNQPPTIIRKDVVAGAIALSFGKQIVLNNFFLVDFFGGVGYGFDNISGADYGDSYETPQYHYGFTVGGDVPLAFTWGFNVGFLTK